MATPHVSVVIPVYNGEDCVDGAIDSALAQRGVEAEVIVVDNGSTDSTPAVLARYAGRIVRVLEPRRGLPVARNAGIQRSRGPLLLFLDADDVYPDGYLARFVAAAQDSPEAEVFHCGWRGVDFGGRELYAHTTPWPIDDDPFHELTVRGAPHIGALMIRRTVLERCGFFDPALPMQEDWDFWLRLAACGARFRGVPGNVLTVRRQPKSMSAVAGGRLALIGLQVLERQLALHPRCSRCPRADRGLESWRRGAARSLAFEMARRLGLGGSFGRWIGTLIVAARKPRLARAAVAELAAGFFPSQSEDRAPVE